MESFSALLRRGRVETGLSYQRIAELVGRSPATIRNWERAKSTPTDPEVVVALAAVLDVSEEDLLSAAGLVASSEMFADLVLGDLRPDGLAELSDESPTVAVHDEEVSAISEETEQVSAKSADVSGHQISASQPQEPPPPMMPRIDAGEKAPAVEPQVAPSPRQPIPATPGPVMPPIPTAEPSYLEDGHQLMTYRVRAALTVAFGIVLLLLFEWGLRGLGTSLKDLLSVIGS